MQNPLLLTYFYYFHAKAGLNTISAWCTQLRIQGNDYLCCYI
jgi:hypothetical protein